MKKIIALGGSNSKNSINKTLATYAASKIEGVQVNIIDLNDFELPLYGADFEAEHGIPENATKLNDILKSGDGFIVSLAEHNGSYAAAFKNMIDWLSRIDLKIWNDKPMLLLATSSGARGAQTVLQTAKSFFPYLGAKVIIDFSLPSFYDNFSENEISKKDLKETLNQSIQIFEQAI